MLLTLPLFSREGKMLESTADALFSTEASAEEKMQRGEILVCSPTSSVGLPKLCILLFNSSKQALMKAF